MKLFFCEDSLLVHGQSRITSGVFAQWGFDNADYNVNTFHNMGGIQITTPINCYTDKTDIPRLKNRVTSSEIVNSLSQI